MNLTLGNIELTKVTFHKYCKAIFIDPAAGWLMIRAVNP